MVDKNTKLSNKKGLTIIKAASKNPIDEGFLKEVNHQTVGSIYITKLLKKTLLNLLKSNLK
jgi:hypothetical protein